MEENWQKENLEKSKKALMEHFEQKKHQRWCEQQIKDLSKPKTEFHCSTIDWEIDESEFDEFNDNFEKSKTNFIEKLIWDPPIEKKSKKKSC